MIRQITRSLSARLLGVFILTALLYALAGRLVYRLVLDQDYLREVVGAHISLHADYVLNDIGTPPDIDRARAITDRVPVDLRIIGPGVDWASDPAFPELDKIPFGPIPIGFLGLDTKGQQNLESWASNLKLVRFGNFRRHAFVELVKDDYRIVMASPRMRDTPRPDLTEPAIWLISIFVLVGCYLSVRWLIRPIKWIQAGAARIGEGELDYRIRIDRRDDLGDLARDINHMAADVRDMLEAKQQLLLAISHELRSPLTRAKVALEFLDDGQVKHDLLGDLREMEHLIADLLESERLNAGHTTLRRRPVELRGMLESLIKTDFDDRHDRINLRLPTEPVVREVDEVRLRLVAKNLIENALRYSPPDAAPVEVDLVARPGLVMLRIRDHGPGIPKEHLSRVTEAFYRADPARSRSTGGLGLGLYLARRIAEAHRGTLVIESEIGQGTLVTVTIPDFVASQAA
ncbi:MAG: HAMP domain-containing histidine kinase [Gammaproteobacteria bacterium]|nr:HAMP domain-containing histidine kinase [Gammaproteobacteria bacterium]